MTERVFLRVEGLMLERLVDRALEAGVAFARIEREDRRHLRLVTDTPGARKVAELCARFHLPCAVLRESGLRPLLARAAGRWTLLIGIALGAALLGLFLSRVWLIDVSCSGDFTPAMEAEAFRTDLRALGICPGCAKKDLDPEALSLALAATEAGCAYVGVRLEGVRLLVEAVAEGEAPRIYSIDEARDLVAARDGVICAVNVRAGKAAVAPGDSVRRGQTLIRGEERVSKEATRGVQALGEVLARTWYTGEASGPLIETRRSYTGLVVRAESLRLLHWRLPLIKAAAPDRSEAKVEFLPVGGLFFPLAVERVTHREYVDTTVEADIEALKQSLADEALAMARAEMARDGAEGTDVAGWTEFYTDAADELRARAVLETEQNIAVSREALYQGGN